MDDVFAGRDKIALFHIAQHRNRENDPPKCREQEGGFDGSRPGNADFLAEHDQQDRKHEWDGTATDVTHRKSVSGDPIHPILCRDIHQKGVIENVSARKADCREHIEGKQQAPIVREAQCGRCDNTDQEETFEQTHFPFRIITDRTEDRREYGDSQSCGRGCIAPIRIRQVRGYAYAGSDRFIKKRQNDRGDDYGVGGICPIVHDPTFFLQRKTFQHGFRLRS